MIAGPQLSRLYWQISTVRLFGRIWLRRTSYSTSLSHVSWGPMVQTCRAAVALAAKESLSVELIDLRSLLFVALGLQRHVRRVVVVVGADVPPRRREADHQQACARIAKRWNGLAPICPIAVGPAFDLGDTAAIVAQPGAALARDHPLVQHLQCGPTQNTLRDHSHNAIVEAARAPSQA